MLRAIILAGRLLCILYTGVLALMMFSDSRLLVGMGGSMLPAIQSGAPLVSKTTFQEGFGHV